MRYNKPVAPDGFRNDTDDMIGDSIETARKMISSVENWTRHEDEYRRMCSLKCIMINFLHFAKMEKISVPILISEAMRDYESDLAYASSGDCQDVYGISYRQYALGEMLLYLSRRKISRVITKSPNVTIVFAGGGVFNISCQLRFSWTGKKPKFAREILIDAKRAREELLGGDDDRSDGEIYRLLVSEFENLP